jgi:replicative DNA helicase
MRGRLMIGDQAHKSPDSPIFGREPQRLPPSNLPAEQALLGAILANGKAYERVSAFLRPEHFADLPHSRIYQAIATRIEAGQIADAVTLKNVFEHNGTLDEVGGTAYLTQLLTAMVGIINAGDYGRAIHDCWVRRQEILIGEQLIEGAYGADPDLSGADVLVQHEDEIAALRDQATAGTTKRAGIVTAWDAFNEAVDRAQSIGRGDTAKPYSTGLPAVDRMIGGGVAPDTLTYMLGAGGAGKTEIALQIAESVATYALAEWVRGGQQGKCPGVLYVMLGNMTARQLGARMAARYAQMRVAPIRRGDIDMEQGVRLVEAGKQVVQLPLEISDDGPSTLGRVLGDMRRVARRRPLVLTIVDNFSDMLSMAPDKMFGTAIGITKALKEQGATAFGSSVMLLMHLNSSVDAAKNRSARPRPSDIPWGTKKDADSAFGVWRPIKYLEAEPEQVKGKLNAQGEELNAKWRREWSDKREPWPVGIADITEVVPMKNREEEDGAEAVGRLRFIRDLHRFEDVDSLKAVPDAASLWEEPI